MPTFDSESGANAGRRSRGGGRPPDGIRELVSEASEYAIRRLRAIASGEDDAWDHTEQFAALRFLASRAPRATRPREGIDDESDS